MNLFFIVTGVCTPEGCLTPLYLYKSAAPTSPFRNPKGYTGYFLFRLLFPSTIALFRIISRVRRLYFPF
jgi:hypothetical protein